MEEGLGETVRGNQAEVPGTAARKLSHSKFSQTSVNNGKTLI